MKSPIPTVNQAAAGAVPKSDAHGNSGSEDPKGDRSPRGKGPSVIDFTKELKSGTPPERGRICMISTHGYVAAEAPLGMPDTGGQVVYVLEVSKKLAQLGFQVDIWTRRFENQPEIEAVAENVRIIRARCGGNEFIPKEFLYKELDEYIQNALQYMEAEGLSYEFINSHYWDAGIVGQTLAETLEIPHLHTPHSLGIWKQRKMQTDFPDDLEKLNKTYNFVTRIEKEKEIYRKCDLVIATTPLQEDMLLEDYELPEKKTAMIPPGYDDSRFYPVSEASREMIRKQFGLKGRVVASIGRLSRNKGFDLLIDAFSVVAERYDDATLFIPIGSEAEHQAEDPVLHELFDKIREHKLEDRVVLAKSLPDEAMPDFYRACDVFVLPSRYEPFGMTAIEAMASGAPSVLTTHGGLYRVLNYGDEALFADSFDKYDLGITICKLFSFPQLAQRVSESGTLKTRELFTWTGIAQQIVAASEGAELPLKSRN